ncbi:RDD family protein [Nocardioides sp. CFH 31398]|uniref:RDD family protein n=1 Tax=Nocardioides sp. CFH 31398 TaxID=2919579 RepID=UPI001F059227|nr:RDD family protein [Nocardioides sp. CFH 31398]MCH1868929.1 RDD family protein [Nocardioides sp. CFH 31398]
MDAHPSAGARELATLTDDDLVTGEAVALDLPPAGLAVRIGSGLVDVVATLVLLVVGAFTVVLGAAGSSGAVQTIAFIGLTVTVFLVFPTTMETLTRGRTLGKLAFGLRTVREDAGPISFQHALVRSMIGYVEIYALTGVPAFFSMLLSSKGKRLGDYAAGTYVVRERVPLRLDVPAAMPPPLAGWAQRADMTALPTSLALAVRQFLGRAATLEPASRHTIGADLARQVSAHVAPPPPPGTPPEAFLAAVVAERRERDARRLAREAQLRHRLVSGR